VKRVNDGRFTLINFSIFTKKNKNERKKSEEERKVFAASMPAQ
jgi:hypothetical protein